LLGEVSGHRGNRRPARGVLESFTVAHADRVNRRPIYMVVANNVSNFVLFS